MGRSTNWDDPAIQGAFNPKGSPALPNTSIVPVWRSDGSGEQSCSRRSSSAASRVCVRIRRVQAKPAFQGLGTGAKGSSGVHGRNFGHSFLAPSGYISTVLRGTRRTCTARPIENPVR